MHTNIFKICSYMSYSTGQILRVFFT